MLWSQKEPAERKVAHRDWAPVSFISRNPGQLGGSLNETKFSPSKTILPQEHECLIRGAFRFAPSHSIATTFLLDPYYVTHPITNDAAIQPHRSEYLRSLPTLKGFDRDFPPTSKFTPRQQRVCLGFVIFIHCFLPVEQDTIANQITKIYDVII
jgi:hypothetical protein